MGLRKSLGTIFLYVVASVLVCASLYHHYLDDGGVSTFPADHLSPSAAVISISITNTTLDAASSYDVDVNITDEEVSPPPCDPPLISTTAVLLLGWEVLVIVSPESAPENLDGNYSCLFYTDEVSPARFSGWLPFPERATFTCILPMRARRRYPFKEPVLLQNPGDPPVRELHPPTMIRWNFMVYDSLTTDDDVVLFVKGVNTRQGVNRPPSDFRCVFGDDATYAVKTEVMTSMQEVLRCKRPELTSVAPLGEGSDPVKISLEIVADNITVPSVAYYSPPRKLVPSNGKSLLCATTMVYDVTKFLKEWVLYHSKIGVQKFLLYDNGSDDDLRRVVDELVNDGYDVSTYFWLWPKTQEAGFSHSAVYAKDACTWLMYMDVDEFVYSPSWYNLSQPSTSLLHLFIVPSNSSTSLIDPSNSSSSLIDPSNSSSSLIDPSNSTSSLIGASNSSSDLIDPSNSTSEIGQIGIHCLEFGPSGQTEHPAMGVIQGYNCRRKSENRHKSIVSLDAVDDSLLNVIHHFHLKEGYRTRRLSSSEMVVNHYKYQAWPEFKAKFRRRVSAYVFDWTNQMNPNSNDRAPGVGYAPVEPDGWPDMFCEVRDDRLKDLTLRWFGFVSDSGEGMAWQR